MSHSEPAPAARRRTRSTIVVCLVVSAAVAGVLGYQSLVSSATPSVARSSPSTAPPPGDAPQGRHGPALRGAGGDDDPAVANLDPDLIGALRQAATDAARDGVELHVNSGWRSPEHQDQLLREAIARYGSKEEAARWVATPETSPHVSGDAIDVGGDGATAWLSERGAAYGLCQIYRNEPWHYELRRDAIERGCPPMYADPTHDPRMQQ